ncbi:MAG: 2-isopropylmalate synthase [Actinomycetota bacterium]|nr:2-isopropylmalate synthase [Actinomycetota bacterium]
MARKQPVHSAGGHSTAGNRPHRAEAAGARGKGGPTKGTDVPSPETSDLLYDWNALSPQVVSFERPERVALNDETLRDGLQSPSVLQPCIEDKQAFLRLLPRVGIMSADIGYAGASVAALADVVVLARTIEEEQLGIAPNCAGRTHRADIDPILEAQQRSGVPIEAALFIGSSAIRQWVEGWDLAGLLRTIDDAVGYAHKQGLEVMFVTEDTTRARPEHLGPIYLAAVEAGASRACASDTVGHATPVGVQHLVKFLRSCLDEAGFSRISLDWHGHRDRGLDVVNALAALSAGAERVHGCALGMGERVGNTAIDEVLVNLVLMGWLDQDLTALGDYCALGSSMTEMSIPRNYPVVGTDAFSTSTGVHAAAVAKAYAKGDTWLADRVYSAVPASLVGRRQNISVGPMSGKSNVEFWLQLHGVKVTTERVASVLDAAKTTSHVLDDEEITRALARFEELGGSGKPGSTRSRKAAAR